MGRGKPGGSLSDIHPADLLATTLQALVERNGLDPALVDDVIVGCVSQVGEQVNTSRMAVLGAGFPVEVPATTIDRKCGSSQQAIHFAAQGILAGAYDIVIAGGVESMSRVPMGSNRMGKDPSGALVNARFAPGLTSQGVAAELIAAKWGISREEMDAFAVRSHHLAARAREAGAFDNEIIGVETGGKTITVDETIRPGSNLESLSQLKPSFADPAVSERFPQINWSVTAGNSSQLADEAAAMLIMSENTAIRLGLKPRARFVAFDVMGDDPIHMLTAPIPVTRRILERARMTVDQIDHFEVNEAFASVVLAWYRELKPDLERVNPRGGAIALGHPLGASGVRLMTTMLNALEQTGGRFGLQTMCEAGGLANATLVERL
jgi:acetyl-CoA acyltransferase